MRSVRIEKKYEINNYKKIFIHLNINWFRNKFELLGERIKANRDVLMISETKIVDSLPLGSFLIKSFILPYRVGRDLHGGCILYFISEDISSHLIAIDKKPVASLLN